jgi:hypothetical protein
MDGFFGAYKGGNVTPKSISRYGHMKADNASACKVVAAGRIISPIATRLKGVLNNSMGFQAPWQPDALHAALGRYISTIEI